MDKVAVVTGGNKGIGFAIVEQLAKQLEDYHVYLTARNIELGKEATKKLNDKGLNNVHFHQLDVTSTQSIDALAKYLKDKHGGIDILANNAAILLEWWFRDEKVSEFEMAEKTMKTNFFAMIDVCDRLFPLLRPHARVMNMSSDSALDAIRDMSAEKRKVMTSPMSREQLIDHAKQYLSDVKDGTYKEKGWCKTAYDFSKACVSNLTIIQQRDFDKDSREDIIVNAGDPGYVITDMTAGRGYKSLEEGADTPVYLCLLPPNTKSPKGENVADRKIIPWE